MRLKVLSLAQSCGLLALLDIGSIGPEAAGLHAEPVR